MIRDMRALLSAVVAALLAGAPAAALPGWRTVDGDTIVSPAGERIRIANIDTADMQCHCAYECKMTQAAKAATQSARERVSRVTLGAYERARDRHGRMFA